LNYSSFVSEELATAVAGPAGAKWEGSLNDVKQIQLAAERASVLTHQLLAFARRKSFKPDAQFKYCGNEHRGDSSAHYRRAD